MSSDKYTIGAKLNPYALLADEPGNKACEASQTCCLHHCFSNSDTPIVCRFSIYLTYFRELHDSGVYPKCIYFKSI